MQKTVDLNSFNNDWYKPGNLPKRILWYVTNILFFKTMLPFPSSFKKILLIIFGAEIGKNIVIKPNVNIKYPWFLTIGDNCWIGEGVWIDNLIDIKIGNNVCLSQNSYFFTGNHNYKKSTFDLILGKIILEDGVWIGAKAIVSPKVTCKSHSILATGSVAVCYLEPYSIYQGNPAEFKRYRIIS